MTVGDPWNVPNHEYVLTAASLEQSRHVFRPLRAELEPRGGYRFIDSVTRVGALHVASGTRLRVQSSNAKTALGLVRTPLVIYDEPGAGEVRAGEAMADALFEAQGKPGSPLRIMFVGTLAPAESGWWHDLVEKGSHGTTHVTNYQGDRGTWDNWHTIRKANPLSCFPELRRKLLQRRDEAREDSRLKAKFLTWRLNLPTADAATTLLTVQDWERVCARPVPERVGRPLVACDLGNGRAWSSAVCMYGNGRTEAVALTGGLPGIPEQERRDRVPAGVYQQLVDSGQLLVADGLRVPHPSTLVDEIIRRWGRPPMLLADRARLNELKDGCRGIPIVPRVTQWFAASEDIRATRKLALDGPMSVEKSSRLLMIVSLTAAKVKSDTSGNIRLEKKDPFNNSGRDDVSSALALCSGAMVRHGAPVRRKRRWAVAQ